MSRKNLFAATAAACALALTVSACGGDDGGEGGSGDEPAEAGGAVIMGTTDHISALDPAGAYDLGSWTVILNMYQTVMTIPAGDTTPVPDAAEACEFTDPTTYHCTLKKGQKFSNGNALDAEDVKFTFDRMAKINDPNGPVSIFQESLKSIETPDAQTVDFKLNFPDATWPQRLATGGGAIVDSETFPADKLLEDGKVVGSGVYQLEEYQPDELAQFTANPEYGGDTEPANSTFAIQYFQKPQAMKQAVLEKKVDVVSRSFSPTDIADLKGRDKSQGLTVVEGAGTEKRYLVFDTKKGPGKEKSVRQAVALLIDRKAVAEEVYNGTVQPLYSMVGIGVDGHTEAFREKYGAAPDKAQAEKLLKDAGVNTPVKLEMWWTPSHYGPSTSDEWTEYKRQLEASGLFQVTLKSTEWEEYQKAYKAGQYPSYQIGWFPDFPDPDNDVSPFLVKEPFLYTGYYNPEIGELLKKQLAEPDMAERVPAFEEIQKLAAEDAPIIPLWQGKLSAVFHDKVKGAEKALDPQYFRFDMVSKSD